MDPLFRFPSFPKRACPFPPPSYALPPTHHLLEALLALPDPAVSLDLFLERLLDSRSGEPEKDRTVESAMGVGSALVEAAKRSARKRASRHNAATWPLPNDLSIKVFSMLDTQSLCHATATCSMFYKCATDPLCYANIDLTSAMPKVNNAVVTTMIQRAGKNFQSLKLGIWPSPSSAAAVSRPMARNLINAAGLLWNEKRPRQGRESSVLTRSCLVSLNADGCAAGALLKRLHLYNIDKMDSAALYTALSACRSLIDLEVVGLHVELKRILDSVSSNCNLIERLFIESSEAGRDDSLKSPTCVDLVNGCPNITSLALRGFTLHDNKVRTFVKGFRNLKFVDFSTSYSITGTFLRNLGNGANANLLEVLILRDCLHLKEVEVARFLSALLAGDCKLLRCLVISNKDGLSAEDDWNNRCYVPSIPIARVLKERPDMCLLAEFPPYGRSTDHEHNSDSGISSGNSSQISDLPIVSFSASSSENSSSSDTGSGNEDIHDVTYALYEGNSYDEGDFELAWL